MGIFSTGAGKATRAARDTIAAQQGRASNLTTLINNTYDDPRRAQQTQDFMGALREQLGGDTTRRFTDLTRQTKFATARQGLTGGSVDVSRQGHNLEDLFRRRLADEAQVQDAGNQLMQQDEAMRRSLIQSAYGAAGVGQGATRGMIGQQAQNEGQLASFWPQLGFNIAGDFANAYRRRREGSVFAGTAGVP